MATNPIKKRLIDAETVTNLNIPGTSFASVITAASGVIKKITYDNLKRWIHGNLDRAYGGNGHHDIVLVGGQQPISDKVISHSALVNCTIRNKDSGEDIDMEEIATSIASEQRATESLFITRAVGLVDAAIILDESVPPRDKDYDRIYVENIVSAHCIKLGSSGVISSPILIVNEGVGQDLLQTVRLDGIVVPDDGNNYLTVIRYHHTPAEQVV